MCILIKIKPHTQHQVSINESYHDLRYARNVSVWRDVWRHRDIPAQSTILCTDLQGKSIKCVNILNYFRIFIDFLRTSFSLFRFQKLFA